jgi:hypothetical protein
VWDGSYKLREVLDELGSDNKNPRYAGVLSPLPDSNRDRLTIERRGGKLGRSGTPRARKPRENEDSPEDE